MGFTVYYRSTEMVDAAKRASLDAACNELCRGRTWLSCEPVLFFCGDEDGQLVGGSKPNFMPHPDDVASAESEGLPDGTVQDVVDVLCQLSRDHGIDWEISHDGSEIPVGFIRNGEADAEVLDEIESFGDVADMLGELGIDGVFGNPADDEGEGPSIRLYQPDDD